MFRRSRVAMEHYQNLCVPWPMINIYKTRQSRQCQKQTLSPKHFDLKLQTFKKVDHNSRSSHQTEQQSEQRLYDYMFDLFSTNVWDFVFVTVSNDWLFQEQ